MRITAPVLLFSLWAASAQAQVYKWTDDKGQVHFSDKPPAAGQAPAKVETVNPTAGKRNNHLSAAPDTATVQFVSSSSSDAIQFVVSLRQMLAEKNYTSLNLRLQALSRLREKDIRSERSEVAAYAAFRVIRENYLQQLNDWVSSSPVNVQPYMARANYYYAMAWASRGGNVSSETSDQQIQGMESYAKLARADLQRVIQRKADMLPAYALLIWTEKLLGNDEGSQQAFSQGVDLQPASYTLYRNFIITQAPRWGGSYDSMKAVAEAANSGVSSNPLLAQIPGFILQEAGKDSRIANHYNDSLQYYDAALQLGDNDEAFYGKGWTLYDKKEYAAAAQAHQRAITLYPYESSYYQQLAWSEYKREAYSAAGKAIRQACQLNPENEKYQSLRKDIALSLAQKTYQQRSEMLPGAQVAAYQQALQLAPDNDEVYYYRALYYAHQGDWSNAEVDLKKAIELDPEDFDNYYRLDYALIRKNKDFAQIARYWLQYLELKPNDSKALLEIAGTYYHMKDKEKMRFYAQKSADLGNVEAQKYLQ